MPKKILLVDDEHNIVRTLASRLKANNYEVTAAYDAMQAIKKAREEKPDLVILDIRMPAGGGVGVYENIRNLVETSTTPVIFITAYPSDEIRKKVMDMGADDFIAKPFDAAEVLAKVKNIIGESGQ